jgi:serine/threonine-protein kinase RsbT
MREQGGHGESSFYGRHYRTPATPQVKEAKRSSGERRVLQLFLLRGLHHENGRQQIRPAARRTGFHRPFCRASRFRAGVNAPVGKDPVNRTGSSISMSQLASEFRIESSIPVASDTGIVNARRLGRSLAEEMGFSVSDATLVATAISELARNIVHYAGSGEILLGKVNGKDRPPGIAVIARDSGPGIQDVQHALRDGFSTSGGPGLGLPGVRRIMDEFDIDSAPGGGTTVTAIKWQRR